MVNAGIITMEKKQKKVTKKQSKDISKSSEVVFSESKKEPCETCKEPKEVSIALPKYTKEEMDKAMTIVDKHNITPQEMQWLIGLNNRVLNDKKQYGCGKCHIQVLKNLKNAYTRLYPSTTI